MRPALPLLLLALPLAGCMETGTSRYPSLLPRPIESQGMAEPNRPTPVAAPDPALDKQIAELTGGLDAASKAFITAAQDAEAKIAVARGVPEGSEAWLDAQTALGLLGAKTGPALNALAELDRLAIARGEAGKPPYPALDSALARSDEIARTQAARLTGLEAALKGE